MKQAERIFMISDAAKQVEVEAHVLRYWEDELKLPVKRNEMGHRYYTEEDIELFRQIKDWKEQGLQLKAIRNMLRGGCLTEATDLTRRQLIMVKKGEVVQSSVSSFPGETREQKSLRLQQLLSEMIAQAVKTNNHELCAEIKESLLKELDYQFRLQEEREDEREIQRVNRQEEHYKKIDELIRSRSTKDKIDLSKKEDKQKIKEERINRQKEKKEKQQKLKEMKPSKKEKQPEKLGNIQEMEEKHKQEIKKSSIQEVGKEDIQPVKERKSFFIKRKRSIV